jgi:hypothetical protein
MNKAIKNCFLLSSNVRLESAILNSRLRSKYLNETFNIHSTGFKFNSIIPNNLINLNISDTLNMFEGKNKFLSKALISFKNPLFIFGESFSQRFNNINSLKSLIKNIIPSAILLSIGEKSNSEGRLLIGNINPVNSFTINNSEILFFINIEDNFQVRKILKIFSGKKYWFNSHYSDILNGADNIVTLPALSFYEEESIFVNLEGKPQKTLKGINGPYLSKSIKKFFSNILAEKQISSNYLTFLKEYLYDLKNFKSKSTFGKLVYSNLTIKTRFSSYPLKGTTEDFYRSNNFLKHSPVMAQCSQEIRKVSTNF